MRDIDQVKNPLHKAVHSYSKARERVSLPKERRKRKQMRMKQKNDFMFDKLSKTDTFKVIKLTGMVEELELQLEQQEEFLIEKVEELKVLKEEYENHKLHSSLVDKYDKL